LSYSFLEGQTISVPSAFITNSLDAGENVTLQANDDITVNSPINVSPIVTAGNLTLQAGRSILLNASINTGGGNLSLIANETLADGVVDGQRDPGNAVISAQSGVSLDTGSGTLTIDLKNSTDKTNNGRGAVTILNVGSTSLSSGSTLAFTINGTSPGDGMSAGTYTQVDVNGTIGLNSASLSISHQTRTAAGTTFTIIQSTGGISGTFNGLSEGATVFADDGTPFTISYQGTAATTWC
jgi:hypothetical protein